MHGQIGSIPNCGRVESQVVGCAKSPGHGGATGTASPAILRTQSAAHVVIARCRDRDPNQRPAACAKSPFYAVPAACVSRGRFCTPHMFGPNPVYPEIDAVFEAYIRGEIDVSEIIPRLKALPNVRRRVAIC